MGNKKRKIGPLQKRESLKIHTRIIVAKDRKSALAQARRLHSLWGRAVPISAKVTGHRYEIKYHWHKKGSI